jgi:hypothetical protein
VLRVSELHEKREIQTRRSAAHAYDPHGGTLYRLISVNELAISDPALCENFCHEG